MAQMKEQIKTLEKLSDEERENLSDTEIKTLVIKLLTEMVQYDGKIGKEVKAMYAKQEKCTWNQQ